MPSSTAAASVKSPKADAAERSLLLLALLHRLSIYLVLFFSSIFVLPFDTSSSLQRLTSPPSLTSHLSTALVRWDSLHFLGLASPLALPRGDGSPDGGGGYRFEHSTAFQPGIVWILRWAGLLGAGGDLRQWDPDVAVLVTSLLAALAGAISVPLLYRLLLRHTGSQALASLAAHLSILSPSPSTLVTPTPEPFYSMLVLVGLLALVPAADIQRASGSRALTAAAAFGLATCFRANGILNVGFVWWHLLWADAAKSKPSAFRLLFSLLLAVLSTLLATGPFLLTQYFAWSRFCLSQREAVLSEGRPRCGNGGWTDLSPWYGAYGHVQSEYWGVGLFSYWKPAQLPNFLLAAPVLYLLLHRLQVYLRRGWPFLARRVLTPWVSEPEKASVEAKAPWEAPLSRSLPDLLSAAAHPTLIPLFLHSGAQALLLLVHSHVQIALRFASPGGMPVFWALLAHAVLAARSGKTGEAGGRNGEARGLLWWLVLWNVTSAILYGAFYPPA